MGRRAAAMASMMCRTPTALATARCCFCNHALMRASLAVWTAGGGPRKTTRMHLPLRRGLSTASSSSTVSNRKSGNSVEISLWMIFLLYASYSLVVKQGMSSPRTTFSREKTSLTASMPAPPRSRMACTTSVSIQRLMSGQSVVINSLCTRGSWLNTSSLPSFSFFACSTAILALHASSSCRDR